MAGGGGCCGGGGDRERWDISESSILDAAAETFSEIEDDDEIVVRPELEPESPDEEESDEVATTPNNGAGSGRGNNASEYRFCPPRVGVAGGVGWGVGPGVGLTTTTRGGGGGVDGVSMGIICTSGMATVLGLRLGSSSSATGVGRGMGARERSSWDSGVGRWHSVGRAVCEGKGVGIG